MQNHGLMTLAEAIKAYGVAILDNIEMVKSLDGATGVYVFPPSLADGQYRIRGTPTPDQALITPLAKLGHYNGLDATFQTVLSYTVPNGKTAYIQEISFVSDKPDNCTWRLTVGTDVLIDDVELVGGFSARWNDNGGKGVEYRAGTIIKIEVKTDGTTTDANGQIVGTQEG